MFSIFKKKNTANVDLSILSTDMHSHQLPGIDDGADNTSVSLELIKGLQDLGYKKFITTPHIMWDVYKNTSNTINGALQKVQKALNENQAEASINYAAEYLLDDYFDRLLLNNEPLLTIKNNWVLVEFSFVMAPLNLKEKFFNMQIKGYQPVLAHPERYLYFVSDKSWFDELKNLGCYFQLNILSLTGYYGKVPNELAQYLIKKKYIDLIGTDLHHYRHLDVLRSSPSIMGPVKSLLDSGQILNPTI
jgi:tyrosine-protein phosphatase YwqE